MTLASPQASDGEGADSERVVDGRTGAVADDDKAFSEAAIALLHDDRLWHSFHAAALATQRGLAWDEVAARCEAVAE